MIGERTVEGFSALTLATPEARRHRGDVRPRRRDGGLLAAPPRGGAAGPAGRPARLRRGALDDGDPAAVPVGEPARPEALLGGGPRRRPRLRRPAAEPGSQRAADPRPARRRRAAGGWSGTRPWETGLCLPASFDFGAHDELMAAFPFPHELLLEATLAGTTLTITTTVRASGDALGAGLLRLPPLLPPAGRRPIRLGDRDPGPRAPSARSPDRSPPASARPSACRGAGSGARTFDDAFRRAEGLRPLRSRRRGQTDRALVRSRLSVRAGLRAER